MTTTKKTAVKKAPAKKAAKKKAAKKSKINYPLSDKEKELIAEMEKEDKAPTKKAPAKKARKKKARKKNRETLKGLNNAHYKFLMQQKEHIENERADKLTKEEKENFQKLRMDVFRERGW